MTCDVTHTINENGTSLLHVELDAYNSKCLHLLANPPEDWVENIISSRCQPLCCQLWESHVKDCCKNENIEKKTSKAELILGYEPRPEVIFEPVGRCVDNDDGSCVIEVDIDAIYTKKIQELLPNFCKSVKSIICENVELEAEEILDKVAHKGEHVNKNARDIIMEYQHERLIEEETDESPNADNNENRSVTLQELQSTKEELQSTKEELQITKDQAHNALQTVADMDTRLRNHENNVQALTRMLEEERQKFQDYVAKSPDEMIRTLYTRLAELEK